MIYRRLLRLAAVPVTNRRWAAPLSAIAVGFGLFIGVAIGPGASGTLATGAAPIVVEIPGISSGGDDETGGKESMEEASAAGSSSGPSPAPLLGAGPAPVFSEPAPAEFTATGPPATPPTEPESPAATDPEEEELQTLAGVVVHVNPEAGSYTLAEKGGALNVIHSGKPPAPGTEVEMPVRLLANGTFAEAGRRVRAGRGERATLSGIVTYVDPTAATPGYVVSKRGVSVLVHVRPDPTGAPAALPVLGALAEVRVEIERLPAEAPAPTLPPAEQPAPTLPPAEPVVESPQPPAESVPTCAPDPSLPIMPTVAPAAILWQLDLGADGAPFTYGDFEGVLAAVCPDSAQLAISADDIRQGGRDLIFTVPAEIDTADFKVGQSVAATATIADDGSLTLTGLSSDERIKGADDAAATRGDLAVKGGAR